MRRLLTQSLRRGARRAAQGLGLCLALPLLAALPAAASPIYNTANQIELAGSRSVDGGGGLTGFNDYASGFTVEWVIDFDDTTPGLWHYKYTFTGIDKDISHFVLDLTNSCVADGGDGDPNGDDPNGGDAVGTAGGDTDGPDGDDCIANALLNGSAISAEDIELGDFDGITGAVKFDVGGGDGVMYEFDSTRSPVWGHLAVKSGGGPETCDDAPGGVGETSLACNDGLLAGVFDTGDPNDYVARPDGGGDVIPEPATGALMGLGLLGLGLARRTRVRH